jgi:iron(II)-dependent oxidoreductase
MSDISALDDHTIRQHLAAQLDSARARTHALIEVLDDAELTRQHSPIMSPLVWDFAHVGNQEELWVLRDLAGREPMMPEQVDQLYDMFQTPRAKRAALPLLHPGESRRYIGEVRARVLGTLERIPFERDRITRQGFIFALAVQHEQQHDETMLATHQLRAGAAVLDAPPPRRPAVPYQGPAEVLIPGGPFTMGTSSEPWALDNERPAHEVDIAAFWIDTTPVTNEAYAAFVADGGYDDPRWWSGPGWAHRQETGLVAPQFWRRESGQWVRRRFGRDELVPPAEPVQHVCWYEADAYARWAGKRLPTEAEWEKAARWDPVAERPRRYPWGDEDPQPRHANLAGTHLRPAEVGAYPEGVSPSGVHQLIGDVWEWTASDFLGYPGFTAWPYRQYSEVFFGREHKVLRGGSWAADPVACRGTFRNWDYPIRRQIFAGFRCARDFTTAAG